MKISQKWTCLRCMARPPNPTGHCSLGYRTVWEDATWLDPAHAEPDEPCPKPFTLTQFRECVEKGWITIKNFGEALNAVERVKKLTTTEVMK